MVTPSDQPGHASDSNENKLLHQYEPPRPPSQDLPKPRREKTVAIIPAPSNNPGFPDKYSRRFGDKPLITHTILAAKGCPWIDEVYISTDSLDLAVLAQRFGARAEFIQPGDLVDANIPLHRVIDHFVEWYEGRYGKMPDHIVYLDPNYPLRSTRHVTEALTLYNHLQVQQAITGQKTDASQAEILVSVSPMAQQKRPTGTLSDTGQFQPHPPEKRTSGPQNQYQLETALACGPTMRLYGQGFNDPPILPYLMSAESCWAIDRPVDLTIAEALLAEHLREEKEKLNPLLRQFV